MTKPNARKLSSGVTRFYDANNEWHCTGCGSITCVCWQCKAKDAYRATWEGAPNVIGKRGAAEREEGER